jgi:hypothetical protein
MSLLLSVDNASSLRVYRKFGHPRKAGHVAVDRVL